jgi:hypothetical protein
MANFRSMSRISCGVCRHCGSYLLLGNLGSFRRDG